MSDAAALLRALPSMDSILKKLASRKYAMYTATLPRPLAHALATRFLDQCREKIRAGGISDSGDLALARLLPELAAYIRKEGRPHFRRVLNATGVVIHTNLGRSLLAPAAVEAVRRAAARYGNLEFDLQSGERGSRYSHVEELICRLTGAEAALVVNNNAAAVLLTLDTLCKGREVIVSRGELVEIGGSFRIPDVMKKSGCFLKEVGATNRTRQQDYEDAIGPETAALMKVHTSNYRIVGFCGSVPLASLARLAQAHGIPLIEDLGSGNLFDFAAAGIQELGDEPLVSHSIESGADIVTFSGDKALGGPQAGIIAGKKTIIDRIKKNPMNRALRCDKLTLAALEATLRLYIDPELAAREVPTLRMLLLPASVLRTRARALMRSLRKTLAHTAELSLLPGESRVGGGSFPEKSLSTTLVAVRPLCCSATQLRRNLLAADIPLLGRLENDCFLMDPRTIAPDEYPLVAASLCEALSSPPPETTPAHVVTT